MIRGASHKISTAISSAASLELYARNIARGLQLGKHASRKLGIDMEFDQFRKYVQGDDLRLLDWKMYAKTDQYYIRQSVVETNNSLHITIDNSMSMDYKEEGISKLDKAKIMVATLTYIMARQADQFSWKGNSFQFSKSQGLKNWRKSIIDLHRLEAEVNKDASLSSTTGGIHAWITDLYADLESIESFLSAHRNSRTEMVLFHIIGHKEENLTFDNNSKFIDLESGEEMQVDVPSYASDYKEVLGQHIHAVKRICQNKGIVYRKIYLQSEVSDDLRTFLSDYNALSA